MSSQFAKGFNNYATTVASPYSPGSGILTVASTAGITLAAGEWFRLTLLRSGVVLSILKITAVSGVNLTVDSAIEGTTDVALSPGDSAKALITAGTLTDLQGAVVGLLAAYAPILAGAIGFDDGTGFRAVDSNLTWDNTGKILSVGGLKSSGAIGVNGATPPAKAAAPTLLADVITIIRNIGFCN